VPAGKEILGVYGSGQVLHSPKLCIFQDILDLVFFLFNDGFKGLIVTPDTVSPFPFGKIERLVTLDDQVFAAQCVIGKGRDAYADCDRDLFVVQ